MMHCTQCGKEIPEGAQFCPSCGAGRDGTPAGMTVDDTKYTKGWSWGGFFAPWIFMFVHKQKKLGWLIVLMPIAVWAINFWSIFSKSGNAGLVKGLGVLAMLIGLTRLIVSIVVGINGRSMVWKKGVYTSVDAMKKRSKFGGTLTIVYVIVAVIIGFALITLNAAKTIAQKSHEISAAATSATAGTIVTDDVMHEALADAKIKYPMITDADFIRGYMIGTVYGADSTLAPKSIQNETPSFAVGYSYGFGVSCMQKYDDKATCSTRDQQALSVK